jgi:carbonic anhydrase
VAARAESHAHWTYEGHHGPSAWGKLEQSFRACSDPTEQSPIDLRDAVKADLAPLAIDWHPQVFKVVNNGHTIQANAEANGGVTIGGNRFTLAQFHFHTPSEHALNGQRAEMEAHFVNADDKGGVLVVGVFMKAGASHPPFAHLMASAPKEEGSAVLNSPVDPSAFLPADPTRFRYEGSLTTPPCSEIVDWNIYAAPIEVAQSDIDAFKSIFPMNARPLQNLGRRFLLETG